VGRLGRRPRTPRLLALLATTSLAALSGCALPDWGADRGATEQGRDMFALWQWSVLGAVLVGGLVWGLIVWALIRYRRRRAEAQGLPSQRQYIIPLELFYTIAPIVVVGTLFAYSYATQESVDRLDPDPDVTVQVIGFQWQWQFEYVGEDVRILGVPDREPTLVLPTDATVRFRLESRDVIHSFYVPGFLFKRDVIPGITNEFDVEVTDIGTYRGHCAEFCGLDHAKMNFDVETMPRDEFERWLDDHRDAGSTGSTSTTTPQGGNG